MWSLKRAAAHVVLPSNQKSYYMAFSTCCAGLLYLTRNPVCLHFNILKLTFFLCLWGVWVNTSLLPSQGLQSFSDKSGCCKKHQFIVHLHNAVPVCGNKFLMLLFFFFWSVQQHHLQFGAQTLQYAISSIFAHSVNAFPGHKIYCILEDIGWDVF